MNSIDETVTSETIRNQTDHKSLVAGTFLDISEVFDSIDHNFLFKLGFDSTALSVMKSYVINRSHKIVISGT